MHRFGGGCQVPVAALCVAEDDGLYLRGAVIALDGKEIFEGEIRGSMQDAEAIGTELAKELLADGAGRIIEEIVE